MDQHAAWCILFKVLSVDIGWKENLKLQLLERCEGSLEHELQYHCILHSPYMQILKHSCRHGRTDAKLLNRTVIRAHGLMEGRHNGVNMANTWYTHRY